MDPFVERTRLRLRPLPPSADVLLRRYHASQRLIAHHILVHDVACQLLDAFRIQSLADAIDAPAVLFGAAIHDIGKIIHANELSEPGHQHEHAGKQLLLQADIPPELARFAETHARWATVDNTIDDCLVALADTCWKGKRDQELEQWIVADRVSYGCPDQWATFLIFDEIVEKIAAMASRRLTWQALFSSNS